MTRWRPRPCIRVIAIGLLWQDGRLLASEVLDDAGRLKGVRPLGGAVEFGETWAQALVREFREELGIEITVSGPPVVLENIFCHEGRDGHEVVFAAPVTAPDGAFVDQTSIEFAEDNSVICTARWYRLEQLEKEKIPLFPLGLRDLLGNS